MLLTGIGDVVHGLPLASDLKRHVPDVEVVWIAEPAPAEVVRHHPAVDHVVAYRKRDGLGGLVRLRRDLAPLRCDLVINCMRYLKGTWPALLTRAPVRLGLPPAKTRDGVRFLNTHALPDGPWEHTQDMFLRFRAPLGIPLDDPVEWRITFTADEQAAQSAWTSRVRTDDRPLVGLVLATANPAKNWPAELHPALVDRLVDDLGARVVLVGGPSDRERAAAARIAADARHASEVIDGLGDSVRTMMWRVAAVDALVSPDTGPLHLAHALGTPVVGLFGHTNPARVGPWRHDRDLVVDAYHDAGEMPDPARYDPREGRMERIGADAIIDAVRRALARPRRTSGT